MQMQSPADERLAAIARIAASKTDTAVLQRHVADVIKSSAFQGSHRSGQFLEYIVKKALAGQIESLKERIIGIELFGRDPSYDTAGDSIVRVTASEVRKRLLQHYGKYGSSSAVRISLPTGSYMPEITFERNALPAIPDPLTSEEPAATGTPSSSAEQARSIASAASQVGLPSQPALPLSVPFLQRAWPLLLAVSILLLTVNLASLAALWNRKSLGAAATDSTLVSPWPLFLASQRPLHLITSDPSIFQIQTLSAQQMSVSDYANHNYLPGPLKLSPEANDIYKSILRGDKSASAADPPIAASIAALAQSYGRQIDVQAARNIQFSDLKNDDNFIFLGSPLSNPWTTLFTDELDFRFVFDPKAGQEDLVNVHPHINELAAYHPTSPGWATGESYAIVALVKNPDQNGRALLIAGASGEGTSAAGKLVVDLPRLAGMLQQCGLPRSETTQGFELLLKLTTLAGSPHGVDVVACHSLP